jgi:adenylate cyclase
MKHQQSFSSLSSGGGTPNQTAPSFPFNAFGQVYTPAGASGASKPTKHEEPKAQHHHHHGLFHRHHSPSQGHTTPGKGLVIDHEEIILDTDLGKLQGIVSNKVPQSVLDANGKCSIGEINPIAPWETSSPRTSTVIPSAGPNDATWTAPESWGVRPHNSITEELPEFPEENVVESRQTYCLRVFRTDSTFATIPCPANTSVLELIALLSKKFFVPVGEQWVLVHYLNNLARVMQPSERPVLVQQKSLERLGYVEDVDGGGEMGRDDWSGFWRFVFMRTDELSNIAVWSYVLGV